MPSRESSIRNLEKARSNWRAPRPLRSVQEGRLIRRIVWQWSNSESPEKSSGRALARWLGVSHTWIQNLLRKFAQDPSKMQREERLRGSATIAQLSRARELTRDQKACGWLREPNRWKRAEYKVGDHVVRVVVPTKASLREPSDFNDILPEASLLARQFFRPLALQERWPRRWRPGSVWR